MLTDKAKIDFEIFLIEEGYKETPMGVLNFWYDKPVIKYAIIIEWFDKMGIGIDTYTNLKTKGLEWGADIMATFDIENDTKTINLGKFWKTRIEATEAVIVKANELYNAKYS